MDENTQQIIEDILKNYNARTLKRAQGDFQFTDVDKEIDGILDFTRELSQNKEFYDILPTPEQELLRSRILRVQDLFSRIKNFTPTSLPNPQEVRNSFAEQLKGLYGELFVTITQMDTFRLKSKGAQGKLSNLTAETQNVLQDAKSAQQQILELLQAAKKTTSRVTLYEYEGIFSKVSTKYKRVSYIWLALSVIVAGSLTVVLYNIGNDLSKTILQLQSTQAIISLVIVKLFFVAIVVYLLQQCIRNYMANMHQGILNEQRENSLKVFDAMTKSSSSSDTADQVLTYLSKSIFDSGETGFFPGKDISKDGPDLIQIFKDIGKPK